MIGERPSLAGGVFDRERFRGNRRPNERPELRQINARGGRFVGRLRSRRGDPTLRSPTRDDLRQPLKDRRVEIGLAGEIGQFAIFLLRFLRLADDFQDFDVIRFRLDLVRHVERPRLATLSAKPKLRTFKCALASDSGRISLALAKRSNAPPTSPSSSF